MSWVLGRLWVIWLHQIRGLNEASDHIHVFASTGSDWQSLSPLIKLQVENPKEFPIRFTCTFLKAGICRRMRLACRVSNHLRAQEMSPFMATLF